MKIKRPLCLSLIPVAFCMGCDEDAPTKVAMSSRPVTVQVLVERDYARERNLTGVVSLYREERIGFEVGGRVRMVLDEGLEVRGPAFDEDGELVRPGDPIASMEDTRYDRQVGALRARLDAALRDLDAVQARVTLARQTLERQERILVEGAGGQQAVDDARSAFDQAQAGLRAKRATVNEVSEQLRRAGEDLGDAVLFAPFSERITKVHVAEGAVVEPGAPVVTLTLMDPVHVRTEVSADDEREIKTGDRALIFPKDPLMDGARIPVNAIVFEKSAVADPKLRTFRIDLIVRNQRRLVDQLNPELEGLPIINDYLPVVREYQGETGPLYVHTETVLEDEDERFVLRLPGVSFNPGAERSAVGKHIPEKIAVSLGNQYMTVVNWNFRSLVDSGDLVEGDFLIVGAAPEHLAGVAIGRPQWLLRPGDLVPVQINLSATPRGFYVPIRAITLVDDGHAVFVVEDGRASLRRVSVHETFEELRRVEGKRITRGAQLIVGGVHYVSDGQQVAVTEKEIIP